MNQDYTDVPKLTTDEVVKLFNKMVKGASEGKIMQEIIICMGKPIAFIAYNGEKVTHVSIKQL